MTKISPTNVCEGEDLPDVLDVSDTESEVQEID